MSENTPELHLPESSAASEVPFATTPEAVKSWLEELPLADAGVSSRQVFQAIFALNRIDITHQARLKITELFLQPVSYLSDNLKNFYFDLAFPLSEKRRNIALLNRELYAELAVSYKRTIEQLIGGKHSRAERKLLVVAIHRALHCLSRVLYQSAIVYEPYPPGSWSEIHQLYAYSEEHRIHQLPVKTNQEQSDSSSIEDVYRRILLFAISSPYRLRQRESEYIQARLPEWSRLTTLEQVKPHEQSSGLFISRLDTDLPPAHRDLQRGAVKRYCRQLNTQRLARRLADDLKQPRNQGRSRDRLSIDDLSLQQLASHMSRAFSSTRKRKFVRTKLNSELMNVVGLADLHAILSARKPQGEESLASKPSPQVPELDWFDPRHTRPLINNLLYTSKESTAYTLIHMEPEEQFQNNPALGTAYDTTDERQIPVWRIESEEQMAEPFPCTTLNQSANGYCVRWQGLDSPRLRVGEILGIQSDNQLFNIGVSRWLKHIPGEGLNVGMELISPSSTPVFARLEDTSPDQSPRRECLLLPGLEASGRPATLVLPALPFKTGDRLSMEADDQQRLVRLTELVEATGSFARFQFRYLDVGG